MTGARRLALPSPRSGDFMYNDPVFAKAILETIREPLIVLDNSLRVVLANRSFYRMFEVTAEETVGRALVQIGDGQWDVPALKSLLEEIIPQESSFEGFEVDHDFPKLGHRLMLLNARRIEGEGERPDMILLAFQDETARRAAEGRAAAYAAELERSNRDLEDFASVASHDLQEPLRKIRSFGERLEDACGDTLEGRARDYLTRMLGATGRMQALIDDLLTYGRISTKARPFATVDLRRIVAEVLRDLDVAAERAGASIEVGPLPIIEADPSQMRQVFQNLIGNALKFRRPDVPPKIKIQGETITAARDPLEPRPQKACRITVRDNGIGFDPKYSARIFQLFERLHSRQEYEGTGMGLAISRKIVERHGGSITATGIPGQGSTFEIMLPLRRTPAR